MSGGEVTPDLTPAAEKRLNERERGHLRDWFDQPARWSNKIGALYRLVEGICRDHSELAWEQGWVARGNHYAAEDNPYSTTAPTTRPHDAEETT